MTVTYTWSVTQLITSSNDLYQDIVQVVNWKVSGTDGTNTEFLTGSTSFAVPENGFVDYSDLEEDQVIAWVKASIGELRVNEVEGAVAAALSQDSYQDKPLPWNQPKAKPVTTSVKKS